MIFFELSPVLQFFFSFTILDFAKPKKDVRSRSSSWIAFQFLSQARTTTKKLNLSNCLKELLSEICKGQCIVLIIIPQENYLNQGSIKDKLVGTVLFRVSNKGTRATSSDSSPRPSLCRRVCNPLIYNVPRWSDVF